MPFAGVVDDANLNFVVFVVCGIYDNEIRFTLLFIECDSPLCPESFCRALEETERITRLFECRDTFCIEIAPN